jgi:hypothetical protein
VSYKQRAIKTECRRRELEVMHTMDPEARKQVSIANRLWAKINAVEFLRDETGLRETYQKTYRSWFGDKQYQTETPIEDQTRWGRAGQVGMLGSGVLEIGFAGMLAKDFFRAPAVVAFVIGMVIAILATAVCAPIAAFWVSHNTHNQPLKEKARVKAAVTVLGIVWLVAVAVMLAVFRSEPSSGGDVLFLMATTILTVISPLLCGICKYAASLFLWSERVCLELRKVRLVLRQLQHLLELSTLNLPPGSPGPKGIGPSLGVLLLILMICVSPARATGLPVYVFADVSPSARAADVAQVFESLSVQLANYHGANPLVISVVPFFENAYFTTAAVKVTLTSGSVADCPKATELVGVSRTYHEAYANKCAADATRARLAEISKLTKAVNEFPKLAGHCTAVNASIKRAASEAPHGVSIVISDMDNSCPSSPALPINLKADNRVYLVPVGSQKHSLEERLEAIKAEFTRLLWVQVVEPYRLNTIIDALSERSTETH